MFCTKCPDLCATRKQIVRPSPCQPGGLLAIGEALGADEDAAGMGFVGRAGKTLDALLAAHGIQRHQYGRANIVRCRPPGNRKPEKKEMDACLPFLAEHIQETSPKVLLLVGKTATEVFLGGGHLNQHINNASRQSSILLAKNAHYALQEAVRRVHATVGGLHAIPMPHTSPLAFNRYAPDGRKWSAIAEQQVALAVSIMRASDLPVPEIEVLDPVA